ncbi:hypothetical protein LOCC1_G004929 [Lachnellula occidentalis]|uniref:DUF1330 domain-containing protein n=1 Tax=Lachnellula occidentalis TaxID=215460 RepID=A0A8H8RZD4_9HELO|nr:hypothetical protein LOCC1_G004929 [Lachnellula occidentalis]
MPLCTIHLLSLTPKTPISQFLTTLHTKTSLKPLTIARLGHPPHHPLHQPPPASPPTTNPTHLHPPRRRTFPPPPRLPPKEPAPPPPPPILHPTPNRLPHRPPPNTQLPRPHPLHPLRSWITSSSAPTGAISMLNLLSFRPGKKDQYLKYGAEFAASIGSRRGGSAKIVGSVIGDGEEETEWDEIALAHYPSLAHFADMLAGEDYQAVNQKYRVGSLKDTCILCTSELGLDERDGGGAAKL